MKTRREKKAFTLLELLFVLGLVAALDDRLDRVVVLLGADDLRVVVVYLEYRVGGVDCCHFTFSFCALR